MRRGILLAAISAAIAATAEGQGNDKEPLVLRDQGSFMTGGTVMTAPNGDTFHGDHAYVQFQIPLNPRDLPLVIVARRRAVFQDLGEHPRGPGRLSEHLHPARLRYLYPRPAAAGPGWSKHRRHYDPQRGAQ